jgi:hypothetical protein
MCCRFRVALVLERSNAVELKPSMEDMFDAVRKVCEDIIAITENLPRLALPGTARQLKELEVGGPGCGSLHAHLLHFDRASLLLAVQQTS